MLNWLPEYTIKRSSRSKYISLRISQQKGLILTMPLHVREDAGLNFLQQKKAWILKHLDVLKNKKLTDLPQSINLTAINRQMNVGYQPLNLKNISIIEAPGQITLMGDMTNHSACRSSIKSWIVKQAKYYLPLELTAQSQRLGLTYNRVTIRQQQTRWGSCTPKKDISLNYKLILLPRALMEYILVHELCHTVHLNHSAAFWRLVKKFCPEIKKYHQELRQAALNFPVWL